jgi:hypothetical protein
MVVISLIGVDFCPFLTPVLLVPADRAWIFEANRP